MKIFLEEETGIGEAKTISKIKELKDIKEAKKGDLIHICRHEEGESCSRRVI